MPRIGREGTRDSESPVQEEERELAKSEDQQRKM